MGLIWGQVEILTERMAAGLWLTAASLLPLGLALLGDARLKRAVTVLENLLERLAAWWKRFETAARPPAAAEAPPPVAAPPARREAPGREVREDWRTRLRARWERWDAVSVSISKAWLLGGGIVLLLAAQPSLFMEKFLLALPLVILGVTGIGLAIFSKEASLRIGSLRQVLRILALGLPALLLVLAGNAVILRWVHQNGQKELLGIVLNAAGILILLALLPARFPDPEAEAGSPLEAFSGAARTRGGVWVKVALAALGAVLLYFCREAAAGRDLWRALALAGAGLFALGLSFPWTRRPSATPGREAGPAARLSLNLIRLLAFGVALYLGYHGQKLIAAEKIYAGLFYFGAAAVGLILAFREPAGPQDRWREQPLAWYWELAGVLAVMAVAVWLRIHLLEQIPFGIEGDEAAAIINAREILNSPTDSILAHFAGQPVFYLGPLKIAHQLFGLSNFGIKAMALLYGLLDILALYWLARLLYGPRTALAAASLLTLARWHIHFSRFGYGNTLLILMLTLGFYFLLKGLVTRRKWHFVFSGVALSLSVQTEVAARLVPLICAGLLVFLAAGQRHFFRRNARPLLALMLGVWLAGGAFYILLGKSTTALMGRANSVSIFSNDPNAPRDIAAGFVGSLRSSLTMLNWHGDYRPRHNGGLTGEPMLDFWSAVLFGLGFCYSLYYWKRLRYFVLLLWFLGFMSASIFAIEAPQAHRAFGIVPAVILFMGAFLDRARRLLRETLGRPGVWAGGLAFLVLLVPIARTNYHKYFDTLPSFDAACCESAKYIASLGPRWENFIMTAYLWQGHPPFQAYAGNISGRFFYTAADVVPVRLAGDKNVCYTFILEYPPLLPSIAYFYPGGHEHEMSHPKYGLMFRTWEVTHEQIEATRGLEGRYWSNPDWAGKPAQERKIPDVNLVFNAAGWPLPGGGSADWSGTVWIPHLGRYVFYLYGTDFAEVRIGTRTLLTAGGGREAVQTVRLGGGLHRLRIRARHETPGGRLLFAWSSPDEIRYYNIYKSPYNVPFAKQPVPPTHLFTYPEPKGLLETFYHSNDWTGEPVHQQVQPALLFVWMGSPYALPLPVSAEWRGWITTGSPGSYRFDLEQTGYGEVVIDGKTVVTSGSPPPGYGAPSPASNPVPLSPGRHSLRVRWLAQHGAMFKFWWTPPGGKREIVPAWVLTPAEESP